MTILHPVPQSTLLKSHRRAAKRSCVDLPVLPGDLEGGRSKEKATIRMLTDFSSHPEKHQSFIRTKTKLAGRRKQPTQSPDSGHASGGLNKSSVRYLLLTSKPNVHRARYMPSSQLRYLKALGTSLQISGDAAISTLAI